MSEETAGPKPVPGSARIVELIQRPGTAAVLILGEMGAGKSAVLDATARQVDTTMEPLRLHGSPSLAKVPYGVLAPFLGELPPEEAGSRVEVLRAFWRAVEVLRRDQRSDLLLVIDDAHELDTASSEVVAELVSARWTKALIAAPSGAALPRPLMELWLDGGVERVDLLPLTVEQVGDFIESAVGGHVLPSIPRLFWQASEGNPLVLGRLVDEARRTGTLAMRGQTWIITGELPHRADGLIGLARAQLARLTDAEREALSLIVVAEPAPFELVERECGAETIRRLVDTRLVRPPEGPEGVLRLRHPVYGNALLALIPYTTSLKLRQNATAYVARQTSTAEGLLRAVTWALDCGFAMDDETLLRAARLGLRLYENALAVRAAAAIEDRDMRLAANEVLGQVAHSRGDYAEAAALLRPKVGRDGVARVGLTAGLVWIFARTALGHSPDAVREDLSRLPADGTTEVLGIVADTIAGDTSRAAERVALWHAAHAASGTPVEPGAAVEPGASIPPPPHAADGAAEPGRDALADVVVGSVEAELLVASGRGLQARAAALGPLSAAVEAGAVTPFLQTFVAGRLLLADLTAGEWEAAEQDVQRFLSASSASLAADGAAAETARGLSLLRRGFFRQAFAVLSPAVDALRERDPQHVRPMTAATAAYAAVRLGENDAARGLLVDADDPAYRGAAMLRPLADLFAAAARDGLASAVLPAAASAGAGDQLASLEHRALAAALSRVSGSGRLDLELQAELLWLEAGRRDRLGRLLEVAQATEGRWAASAAHMAAALADGTPVALLDAAESLWDAGAVWNARECFAEASRGLDRVLRRADARAAWTRKTECDAVLGDEGPALAPRGDTKQLTRREREIVAFAVAGLSDREIAERLTVSVRTVEGHLYRAYSKLDVTSREQLTSAMGRTRRTAAPGIAIEYTSQASK